MGTCLYACEKSAVAQKRSHPGEVRAIYGEIVMKTPSVSGMFVSSVVIIALIADARKSPTNRISGQNYHVVRIWHISVLKLSP